MVAVQRRMCGPLLTRTCQLPCESGNPRWLLGLSLRVPQEFMRDPSAAVRGVDLGGVGAPGRCPRTRDRHPYKGLSLPPCDDTASVPLRTQQQGPLPDTAGRCLDLGVPVFRNVRGKSQLFMNQPSAEFRGRSRNGRQRWWVSPRWAGWQEAQVSPGPSPSSWLLLGVSLAVGAGAGPSGHSQVGAGGVQGAPWGLSGRFPAAGERSPAAAVSSRVQRVQWPGLRFGRFCAQVE